MPRSIWKGSITFGLVHIPVSLYSGESRTELNLRMLDSRNHGRVRYQRVNAETGEEVPWDAIVRGYEYDEGRYVILSEEEMEKVRMEVTKTVEITDFVDVAEIEPVYFDKPYYLAPEKKHRAARKGYALLRETLRETGKVGIAQVVIRSREYLCAVMVRGEMLVLNVLRFADELRDPSEYDLPGSDLEELNISSKEIEMAKQLVEAMAGPWEPERYEDTYRAALMEWIDKKVEEGQFEAVTGMEEEKTPSKSGEKVVDLMDYLKKSVEDAQKAGAPRKAASAKGAKRKTAARKPAKKKQAKKAVEKKGARKSGRSKNKAS